MYPAQQLRISPQIRPLTTAHLAQTMSLLELSAPELEEKINAELSRNPALEVVDPRRCHICGQTLQNGSTCARCNPNIELDPSDPVVFVSPTRDSYTTQLSDEEIRDEDGFQTSEDLPTYVLRQIAPELRNEDRLIAAFILSNLNDDGLLEVSPLEVAQYYHVPISRVKDVIRLIQRADPIGVGSPSSKDALLIQLEVLGESRPIPELAQQAIEKGLHLINKNHNSELSQLLGVTIKQAEEIVHFIIENLNPFPGRAAWGEIRQGRSQSLPVFSTPDIIIKAESNRTDARLLVEVFSPYAGILRVSPLFRQAISQAPADKIDHWKTDLEQAELLVKCLQQRTATIVRLISRLVVLQRGFVLNGDGYLLPLTRASLAEELQVHESTISRAVSSKTVELPNGRIVPLAKFFDRSLNVRTALKKVIEQETCPLSDSELVDILKRQGFNVARRTVAKYRAMEGILPSHLRRIAPAGVQP